MVDNLVVTDVLPSGYEINGVVREGLLFKKPDFGKDGGWGKLERLVVERSRKCENEQKVAGTRG